MMKNCINLGVKDIRKIKRITEGFEELCKFILEADLVHSDADMLQLKEMVKMYNKQLEEVK